MSKQEWSKEVPVEDGVYWTRETDGHISIADVSTHFHGPTVYFRPLNGSQSLRMDVHGKGLEWLGPLTPPE